MNKWYLGMGLLVIVIWLAVLTNAHSGSETVSDTVGNMERVAQSAWGFPVDGFKARATLKTFGTYVTPQDSPVQPERFRGYHTGVDVEYGDVTGDVSVRAIGEGKVVVAKWVAGYGGVVVLDHRPAGDFYALYGHLDPTTLPKVGASVARGEQIGVLGDGETSETDGERKHLHFSVIKSARVTLLGYVQDNSALSAWMDPMDLWR